MAEPHAAPRTVRIAIGEAIETCAAVAAVGEQIEDEWTYVADLLAAWTARLRAVEAAHGDEPVAESVDRAIGAAADEARLVRDPHRAIDWLSTFPQITLVALGERP